MIVGLPASEFVVLDVETTGLEPSKGDEIIEIAAQKLRGREVVGEFLSLLKPTKPMPVEALAIHGITNEQLQAEGKDPAVVIPEVLKFIGPAIIIAHNSAFDLGFLNAHCQRLGLPPLKNLAIDTLEISKRYLILSSYRLKSVAAFLKVPQPTAHRAMADVETTREVFFRLIERAKQKV